MATYQIKGKAPSNQNKLKTIIVEDVYSPDEAIDYAAMFHNIDEIEDIRQGEIINGIFLETDPVFENILYPTDKANYLIKMFYPFVSTQENKSLKECAIRCALILVDEVLKTKAYTPFNITGYDSNYWQETKKEIYKIYETVKPIL